MEGGEGAHGKGPTFPSFTHSRCLRGSAATLPPAWASVRRATSHRRAEYAKHAEIIAAGCHMNPAPMQGRRPEHRYRALLC